MEFVHRISISASEEIRAELANMGVAVGSGFVSFEVRESFDYWPEIRKWIADRNALDIVSTKFSPEELRTADWLEMTPAWHHGYPQPDEDFGYLATTYDLTRYCEICGLGAIQTAPFRIKKEPKWGRNGILQLNWVFDEFFVTPQVWKETFQLLGIGFSPVLDMKGVELETIVQLNIHERIDIIADDLPVQVCARCGRRKYLPVTRGFSPEMVGAPSGHILATNQYFGSGASAYRLVIVSKALADALMNKKIRGINFRPVDAGLAQCT